MVNRSSVLTDHAVSITIPAFQAWLDNFVIPAWGLDPVALSYVPNHMKVPAGAWPMYLLDTTDVPGAGGYHEDTGKVPDGKVFAKDAMTYGEEWTVDFSHELVEMLVDPLTNRWVSLQEMAGWSVIAEPGDPVEGDQFGAEVNGVLMTDFVLPKYFGIKPYGSQPASMQDAYDWQGHMQDGVPTLLPGGYVSLKNPRGRIRQLFARREDGRISRRAARISRVYR